MDQAPTADVRLEEHGGFVLLRLGGARYAVGMSAVAEVGRLPKLTRVPGTPPWLAGVANWRGRILAILDVRPLLGAAMTPTGSLGRLVVLSDGAVTVGLLTEGVMGVLNNVANQIEPVPMTLDADTSDLLLGQVIEHNGSVAILDGAAVLRLRHRLPSVRRAAS